MDQALKERSLGSATARRRKIQEREQERQNRHEALSRKERARRVQELLEHSSDETSDEEEDSTSSYTTSEPELELEDGSSVQTPSDICLRTPDEMPSPLAIRKKKSVLDLTVENNDMILPPLEMPSRPWVTKQDTRSPPSPAPVLQSSLVTLSDWNYERFSAVFDPTKVQEMLDKDDKDEPYSPIEVATPISYSQPKVRPSVISIYHIPPKAKSRSSVATKPSPAADAKPVPLRSRLRTQHARNDSAFLASEATEFQVPSSPTFPPSQSSPKHQEIHFLHEPERKTERLPSVPLMTAASRYSHLRSPSKKDSIVSNRSSHGPTELLRMSSAPPATVNDVQLSPPPPKDPEHARTMSFRSLTERSSHRPATSHSEASQLSRPPSDTTSLTGLKPSALHVARKKSISALRSRSESIGQALKSVTAKGRLSIKPDMSNAPPLPVLRTPNYGQPLDFGSFPRPPASPAMSTRSSVANFSPFPPVSRGIGLGVKGM